MLSLSTWRTIRIPSDVVVTHWAKVQIQVQFKGTFSCTIFCLHQLMPALTTKHVLLQCLNGLEVSMFTYCTCVCVCVFSNGGFSSKRFFPTPGSHLAKNINGVSVVLRLFLIRIDRCSVVWCDASSTLHTLSPPSLSLSHCVYSWVSAHMHGGTKMV